MRVGASIVAAVLVTAAVADAPPPPSVREEVQVHLRVVDFLALDRNGRPVEDLRGDEIRVREDGRAREILDFFTPTPKADEGTPAPGVATEPEVGAEPASPDAAPPAGRWIILLIDAANLSLQGRILAGQAFADLVEHALTDADHVLLLVNDDELRIVAPVGLPRQALARQLRAADGLSSMQRDMERRLRDMTETAEDCREVADRAVCARQAVDEYLSVTTRETSRGLDRLESLVRSLSAIPERKLLLYASEGLVADPGDVASAAIEHAIGQIGYNVNAMRLQISRDLRRRLDRVNQLASMSRTVFYPVNTLRRMTGSDAFDAETRYDSGPENQPQARSDPFDATWSQVSGFHRELARNTGGVALFRRDPGKEIATLLDASRGHYTLNYEAGALSPKRIKLDCTRPGVKLLYREERRFRPDDSLRLEGELLVGEEAGPSRQPGVLMALLRVLGSPFELIPDVEPATSLAAVYFQVLDAQNAPRASHFEIITFPRDASDAAEGRFLERPFAVKLPPGAYTLRAEVRDVNGGGRGSFTRALEVAPPAAKGVTVESGSTGKAAQP